MHRDVDMDMDGAYNIGDFNNDDSPAHHNRSPVGVDSVMFFGYAFHYPYYYASVSAYTCHLLCFVCHLFISSSMDGWWMNICSLSVRPFLPHVSSNARELLLV